MKQRLYRSRNGKMIGGVCTGLGEYFGLDPVLIRLLFVVFFFLNGTGLLAYIILWIVVPWNPEFAIPATTSVQADPLSTSEPVSASPPLPEPKSNGKSSLFTGYILIGIGVLFLLDNFIPTFSFGDFWPLLLIAIGTGIIWHSSPRNIPSEVEL